LDYWALIGTITGGIIVFVGGIASIIQVIQYIEQHRLQRKSASELFNSGYSSVKNIPQNLPPRAFFIGRNDKREEIFAALHSGSQVIVVEGVGGIGKTSLALEVTCRCLGDALAHQRSVQERTDFFNAFVWITAKASIITIDNLLDVIAHTLDYPYIQQLDLTKKHGEILKLLRKFRALIIIDNFETIQDEGIKEFVEEVPDPSKVLITTRHQITWRKSYSSINVNKLQVDEAFELIRNEANKLNTRSLIVTDHNSLMEMYEVTGGAPLAIKWALGQMKQGSQTLDSVLYALKSAQGDIFEKMFTLSWQLLSNNSKQVLLNMPLFSATVSIDALAAAAKIDPADFHLSLNQLMKLWLLESNGASFEEKPRFSVHPLTLSFVAKESAKLPQMEVARRIRIIEYYLQFCNERRYFEKGPKDYDELEAEVPNMLKSFDWLYESFTKKPSLLDYCQYLIHFSNAINVFFWSRGYWSERVSTCTKALEASKALNAWASAGRQAYFIGIVRFWQGALEDAENWAEESKSCMARTDKPINMALTEHLIGLILIEKNEHEQAVVILKRVLEEISKPNAGNPEELRIFADWRCPGPDGHKAGIASIIQDLGINAYKQGECLTAVKWLDDSTKLAQDIGDIEGLARSLSHRGHALFGLGQIKDAQENYEQGLELATQVQRKSTMGRCNQGLADIAAIEGRVLDAIHYGRVALNLFERLGMRKEKEYVQNLLSTL
jgi:tetratricopeptide (TPR) repeat protein